MKGRLHYAIVAVLPAMLVVFAHGQTNWTAIGPVAIQLPNSPPAAGKLQTLAVNNAKSSVMYAAGGTGSEGPNTEAGVYKTTNGGVTWVHENVGLTDPVVDSIWLNQANPKMLLAGTEITGIFRSTDGGAHWTSVATFGSTPAFLQVGGTLYAGTVAGVAASTDNGVTWPIVQATTGAVKALAAGGGLIYAGLNNGQVLVYASGVWESPPPLSNSAVSSIAVNPGNSQNAFVVENPNVYETQDGGNSWTTLNSPCTAQFLAFDSKSNLYEGCNGAAWQSTNDGATWNPIPNGGWDIRFIIPDFAGVSGNIVIGSDQGLFLSTNAGSTWQSLNGNIKSSILTGLAVHGSTILTTAQDYGPISSFNGGKTWSTSTSGDAAAGEDGAVIFNPGKPAYAYIFATQGFYYSTNGGKTFTANSALPASEFRQGPFCGDIIAVDTKNPSTVYVAAVDGVFKSVDWGVTWALQQSWPSGPVMVSVDPTNSNNIFVGQQSGSLMVSHNAGASWTQSTLPCTNCGAPMSAAVNPSNPQIVLIGMSQANGGILISSDGGTSFASANSGLGTGTYECETGAVPHIRFDPSTSFGQVRPYLCQREAREYCVHRSRTS